MGTINRMMVSFFDPDGRQEAQVGLRLMKELKHSKSETFCRTLDVLNQNAERFAHRQGNIALLTV